VSSRASVKYKSNKKSNKMVNIVDLRPSKPGFDRRRKRRRQKETDKGGASSESCSYWEGGDGTVVRQDGTVIRQDGTVETPVRPGTELDFGEAAADTGSTAAASTASIVSACSHPGTNSTGSSSPASSTITPISKEVTPSEEERKASSDAGASNHALEQESPSVPASAEVATPVKATAPATSTATVGSPDNKLQHQVDFLEEQLQIRSTEIEWLQADLRKTKAQLADTAAVAATTSAMATAAAAITADAHEQAIIEMQQENIRQMQSLTDQYERALQERDARHARVLEQRQQLQKQQQGLEQQLVAQREQLQQKESNEQEFLKEWHQLQELEEKGVRDAQQASVHHVKELQRYKDQLEGSDSKLQLAEEEIRLLKETHRQGLERVDKKYTRKLQQQEHAHRLECVQMEANKGKEIEALRASLREEGVDDSSLQNALKTSEERLKLDLVRADETYHEVLRKRDARHQEQVEELQFALKAQTDEIADLTTSLRRQDLEIVAQKALADTAAHNLQTETKVPENSHDLEKRMKEEYAAELRKQDECHRGELEKLQGIIRSKTSKIAAMKESLHSVEDILKVDLETDADPVRRPLAHPAPIQKPFGHSSQVLEVEVVEPVIASKALPESPKVMKKQSNRTKASSARKEPKECDDNKNATASKRRRSSSPKAPPVASAQGRNGNNRPADSRQLQRSRGTPAASFDYRSAFAANSASRSLSQQWQSPSPVGRDRSPDSKRRKRSGVKLIPGASITNPSSAASSGVSHRTPLRRRESVVKPLGAKKGRIVIDSPGSDSDTVFSNNSV
jgi:myosin heavy subunit